MYWLLKYLSVYLFIYLSIYVAGHPTYHVNAIKLKCDIIWTGWLPHLSELPRPPGVPHLHVNRPYNIADIYGLHQLINEPTRITDKSSALID